MNFPYQGGPVVKCPLVYTAFWGPTWTTNPTRTATANRLSQFHQDLLKSNFMNVLTQYGIAGGKGTGAFVKSLFFNNVPASLTDAAARGIIQSSINAGALPDPGNPTNNVLMMFLDDQTVIDDPSPNGRHLTPKPNEVDGYHDRFVTSGGGHLYYAFESFSTIESLLTQVATHEFAEMVTDPEYNAWTPDAAQTEIGDVCENNTDTITVGADTWTIQKVWSNTDGACVGQAANPLPPLSPGPGVGLGAAAPGVAHASRERPVPLFGGHERVLPLPAVHFDVATDRVTLDEDHVLSYVDKLFSPLRPQHLHADFGGWIRGIMEILERKSLRGDGRLNREAASLERVRQGALR
jgi:hypothetical protein